MCEDFEDMAEFFLDLKLLVLVLRMAEHFLEQLSHFDGIFNG